MNRLLVVPLMLLITPLTGAAASVVATQEPALTPQQPTLVIDNARVLVGDGTVLDRAAVVVAGDRILSVGEGAPDLPGVRRIDAAGRTVTPGLIDAHVHLTVMLELADTLRLRGFLSDTLPDVLRAFVRHGVTTVRSTGEHWPWMAEIRDRVASGGLEGPRIVTSGRILTAVDGHPVGTVCGGIDVCSATLTLQAGTPEAAREAVRTLAADGVDFVKVVQDPHLGAVLHEPVLIAALDEAGRHGLAVVGHIPDAAAIERATDLGIDGFVHPYLDALPVEEARALGRTMAERGAHFTTTVVSHVLYGPPPVDEAPDPVEQALDTTTQFGARVRTWIRGFAAMVEEGAPLVVGTDWCACSPRAIHGGDVLGPGASLLTEMEWLQAGGLPPAAVVDGTTRGAAVALGLGAELGTIEPGKWADLLVVAGDPLVDVSAFRQLDYVVQRGRIVSAR